MARAPWERVDVSDWSVRRTEAAGSSENLWLDEPGSDSKPDRRWMHKDITIPLNGAEQGEDWAEVVSTR